MRPAAAAAACLLGLLIVPASARADDPPAAPPSAPASPAPDSSARLWMITDKEVASVPARTVFPRAAATLTAQRYQEFSKAGEGIDKAIQYSSPDRAVVGTVYLYFPGLPHAGVAAFATDNAIRHNSDTPVTGGEQRIASAGGIERLAIRADYSGYRGGHASSSAFLKAGRWLIKVRVSGPEARRSEVEAAMDALLAGIRFGAAYPPHPAAPIEVRDCPAGSGARDSAVLPDPPTVELAAIGFLATFDGGGIEGKGPKGQRIDLPSRVPERFCLSTRADTKAGRIPILRAKDGPARSIDGRTVLLAPLSDSGMLLELVHARNLKAYILLYHEIGSTTVLGRFRAIPSDRQIAEIIDNPGIGPGRPLVPVTLRPGQGPSMQLPSLRDEPATPAT